MKNRFVSILGVTVISVALVGCATNRSVEERIAAAQAETTAKIESVQTQVEDLQERQTATEQRVEAISKEAQEALERAREAGVLARGKVVFEETFTEDRIRFASGRYELNDEARAALDELGSRIKGLDRPVFIEIQGHTDAVGSERFNLELGERRANEVRRYLSSQHNIPLARMSTISYGETMPAVENNTRANRAQNRRVVIVVLE